jgi:DNA-binding transcriptional LysR family regulator
MWPYLCRQLREPVAVNWEDLRYFLAICRAGTLSAAAKSMGVDQATVSRRLSALEADLGTRLFTRLPREARLTPAGEQVMPLAIEIEERSLAVERVSLDWTGDSRDKVTISAPPILARHLLAPNLKALSERLSNVQLSILSESRFASLSRLEADLAIRLAPGVQDTDIIKKVGRMPFALYGSVNYVHLHDEARWEFIGYTDRQTDFDHKRWIYQLIGSRRVICEVSDLSNQYEAACTGIGIAGLPCFLADAEPKLVRLETREELLELNIWVALHQDRRNDVLVGRTMAAVADLVADAGLTEHV